MKKIFFRYPLLLLILALAFTLRLHRITNEPLDWHAWRQADTASVTRNFVKNGVDLLRPTYHDLSSIPSGLNNPEGLRMVEFPFVNAVVALLVSILPSVGVVVMSRVVSIIFSLGTIVCIFFFVKSLTGQKLAYTSALIFATLPFSIFYGRAILPETALLFFTTFSLLSFQRWLHTKSWQWWLTAGASLALALLLKPFAAFLGTVFITLLILSEGKKFWKLWLPLSAFAIISFAPLWLWRSWIQQFPAGIPASDWLFNGNGIRFRPAWFRWLGYERITKLMLGYVGILPLVLGVLKKTKNWQVYAAWWLSIALYFTIIATGNVQHDYYQVFALPILAITVANGFIYLFERTQLLLSRISKDKTKVQLVTSAVTLTLYLALLQLSWIQVRGYFNTNHTEYTKVGLRVQALTPTDALVISPAFGDTQFLYQTNRDGWPIGSNIDEKIRLGATHYVTTTNDDEARLLEEKYFVIEKTDEYILIDLTKEKTQP
jgi:hypothetical protein